MNTPNKSELGNLLEYSRTVSPMKMAPPPQSAAAPNTSDSLKDLLTEGGESAGTTRINAMLKNFERHQNEKWKKALKHLGINENLFPNKKDEIETFYPFNEFTISNVRAGKFLSRQLEKIVLEITNIDVVNSCFYTKFRDMHSEEIFGVFHSDCKDKIKTERMRKGSVVILSNVRFYTVTDPL